MRNRVLIAWAATLLTACGTAQVRSYSATSTASASASLSPSARPTALIVVQTKAATADQAGMLSLFSTDGKTAGAIVVKPGAAVLAVAGARIFVRPSDGSLQALHRDGSTEVLEATAGVLSGIGGFVSDPDGSRWVWASQTSDTTSQSVFMGGDALSPRKLATNPYPAVLEAYAWTAKGPVLDSLPMDYFGYRPFNTPFGESKFGGLLRVDPQSGTMQPVAISGSCVFSDEAADGSIACFPTDAGYLVPNRHAIRIVSSGAKTTDLSLAVPRFNYVGDAYFSPDGSLLTVAGATGTGAGPNSGNAPPTTINPDLEQYGTDLVQVADGSIGRFGPSGVRPAMGRQSWLPDGRLVLWRPNTIGGPPGLYLLDPHGGSQSPEIEVRGTPLGYLSG